MLQVGIKYAIRDFVIIIIIFIIIILGLSPQ